MEQSFLAQLSPKVPAVPLCCSSDLLQQEVDAGCEQALQVFRMSGIILRVQATSLSPLYWKFKDVGILKPTSTARCVCVCVCVRVFACVCACVCADV